MDEYYCTGNCDDCVLECATAGLPIDESEINHELQLE